MWIFKRPWTLSTILTSFLLISMVVMAIAMLVIGSWGWRQNSLYSAIDITHKNAQLTELKLKNLIQPAASAIKSISEYPINNQNLGPDYQYLPIMLHELQSNELVSAVYIGFNNQDFISIRSLDNKAYNAKINTPKDAAFLLQVIQHNSENQLTASFYFYSNNKQIIETRQEVDYKLDPLDRPWYRSAIEKSDLNISEPYVFFSTQQVGLTISEQVTNQQSVIGMDIALEDLSDLLSTIRITPNTQLAIVSDSGALIGNKDLGRLLSNQYAHDPDATNLPNIKDLNNNALNHAYMDTGTELKQFSINGDNWLGITTNVGKNVPMQLVMAIPMHELLGEAYKNIRLMLILAILIILLSIFWSWWAGGKISKYLDDLVEQARAMARFDFTKSSKSNIPIREVLDLQVAANNVSKTLESILSISKILGSESDIDTMLDKVLVLTVEATHCLSGAVYIWNEEIQHMYKSAVNGTNNYPEYLSNQFDIAEQYNKFELKDRYEQLQGVLILEIDQSKQDLYGDEFNAFVHKLTGMLEVAIETRQLINAQKELFDGMIRMLADAIDTKSPYTGGHCQRVPKLAIMMIDDLQTCSKGPYASFKLNEQELSEFSLAAWLHDCGKIVIPQDIVDKASKLEVIYNRIHEVRMRFEVLWRDAEINYLKESTSDDTQDLALERYKQAQQKLINDYEFVASCNIGSEFLDDESIARLKEIGNINWSRNFDDLLGLPEIELKQRSIGRDANQSLPVTESLLADRLFDQIEWDKNDLISQLNQDNPDLNIDMDQPLLKQNTGELHNLTIRKGTLTEEDRFIIQNHMVHTLLMLHKLPWPRSFKNVRDIASNHHERIDGNGYPRRLKASELPISHRVLAIADVFEALTASDRPYKEAQSISESLQIMANMCLEHHLDTNLFIYFVENRIWLKYANQFLRPEQIDEVDINKILSQVH